MKRNKTFLLPFFIFSLLGQPTSCMLKVLRKAPQLRNISKTACTLTGFAKTLTQQEEDPQQEIFVFVGAPGSGKGTLVEVISQFKECTILGVGEWLRERKANETSIKNQMCNGELLDDSLIKDWAIETLTTALTDKKKKMIILDGFPRTIAQAYVFLNWFAENKELGHFSVVQLHANLNFIEKYALNRASCPECKKQYIPVDGSPFFSKILGICDDCGVPLEKRCDDTPETLAKRIALYRQETAKFLPILESNPHAEKTNLYMSCTKENPLDQQLANFKQILANENGI